MTRHFIGIDLGTSACKVVALAGNGTVTARACATYPLHTPAPGWAEQDPADWWQAASKGIEAVVSELPDRGSVAGIGLSGQMHGLVALDAGDQVLRPAMLWCDQRSAPQCEDITRRAGGLPALLDLVQNRMLPGFTGGKLLWMREHEPLLYAKLRRMLNPKDYLRWQLTGEQVTDVSDASGTGLFDVRRRQWSRELLDRLDLTPAILAPAVESTAATGLLRPVLARRWGLPADTVVYAGGGDAVVQTTSMGIIDAGPVGITLGTASNVTAAARHCPPHPDGRLQISCGNAPGRWHVMGVSLGAGSALQWLRGALAVTQADGMPPDFDRMVAWARRTPPGAQGLLFLPYLLGERCPHVAPEALGAWVGLSPRHDAGHLVRSVMEGVVQNVSQIVDLFEAAQLPCRDVLASGGATGEALWLQLLADVLQRDVRTITGNTEGGACGAALIAAVGQGHWPTLDQAVAAAAPGGRTPPQAGLAPVYRRQATLYRRLFGALDPVFCAIAEDAAPA